MVESSLVMAACVAVTSLVALLGKMPRNRKAAHAHGADGQHDTHDAGSGSTPVSVLDIVFILIFSVAGGFAFNVLAHAGGG